MKNVIVTLRVFRGKLNYDANGNVTSENQTVKLKHDTQEYYNFLKKLRINGYHQVAVEKVVQMAKYNSGEQDVEIKDLSKYSKEVSEAFNPVSKAPKTAEQLRIEKLEAQIAGLIEGKKPKEVKEPKGDTNEELKAARAELKELTGNITYHGWDLETIKEKIEALKA